MREFASLTHAEAGLLSNIPDPIVQGLYRARLTRDPGDIHAVQTLRTRSFATDGRDCDRFDGFCDHLLVNDISSGALVCCARLHALEDGKDLNNSYSGQYYDLSALIGFRGRLAELGRFCVHPDWSDPDILRLAWGTLAAHVEANGIEMLFGCSSFPGIETEPYLDTFALLKARHLAPGRWLPGIKAPTVFHYAAGIERKPDVKRALRMMPPLLRSYLMMGAWVSDHAVIDRQMNTLHVFTGLEIDTIPPARKRILRAVAG